MLITAKAAREMTARINEQRSVAELEAIENQISEACKYGHTRADVKGKLQSTTVKRLEELGYVVTHTDYHDLDGTWTTISW